MILRLGQVWKSEKYPHEDFKIYDGIADTCVDAFQDESIPFDEQPETVKIFFWERANQKAFNDFVDGKLGVNAVNTFPYMWCGECKKQVLIKKIKEYEMKLAE